MEGQPRECGDDQGDVQGVPQPGPLVADARLVAEVTARLTLDRKLHRSFGVHERRTRRCSQRTQSASGLTKTHMTRRVFTQRPFRTARSLLFARPRVITPAARKAMC